MHTEARAWLTQHGHQRAIHALDVGGRDINGTVHDVWPNATWTVLDNPGPGVDIVADAATWTPDRRYDLVLCTEVLEHAPRWRDIIGTCARALAPGGTLLVTAASDPRPPHSGNDGGPLRWDEHYANIDWVDLAEAVAAAGLNCSVELNNQHGDVYAWATCISEPAAGLNAGCASS